MSLYEQGKDGSIRRGAVVNMEHCRESVWGNYRFIQCPNKVKVTRDGIGYCGVHDPVRLAAKREAKREEHLARYRVRQRIEEEARLDRQKREHALKAIEMIASGYNDPQSLARSVLDGSFGKKEEGVSEQV